MLEVTAYTGIEPGIHAVHCTALDPKPAKTGGDYLRWEFTRDNDGKTTSANSSIEMTPGNKTGKWFASLTGKPTVVGEKRSRAEVIGKPCTIVVELNADGFTKVIALTGREDTPRAFTPASVDIAATNAQAIHAAQEGDDQPQTEIGVLP